MAQYYPKKGMIEASFVDDGVTIPRSLGEGTGAEYAPGKAHEAILDALHGKSAKEGEGRGFGLQSSVRLVNALGGQVLVVSGSGAVVAVRKGEVLAYSLNPQLELDGTLVSLRLSDTQKRINLFDEVE